MAELSVTNAALGPGRRVFPRRRRRGTRPAVRSGVRASSWKSIVAVSVVLTVLSASACRKSAEEERREAQKATEEAEQKASQVSQTSITSAEIGASDGPRAEGAGEAEDEVRLARERALREQAEAIIAARNEQLAYRAKLQSALDQLDAKRRDAKKHGHVQVRVKAIDARRELLKHDLEALARTTDTEWAALKAKIDRDLKDHAGAGEVEGK